MKIGVPSEVKSGETRVSMTPATCAQVSRLGARVLVEKGAGWLSGFPDSEYEAAGAELYTSAAEIYAGSDLVVKVKEPQSSEYDLMRSGQCLFTYLHLAAAPDLAKVLQEKNILAIGYETMVTPDGQLPLLKPMSQIAGRLSVQVGASFLQSNHGGAGILLGGVPGVHRGHVVILGLGNAGSEACRMAVGLGATVTAMDVDRRKLEHIDEVYLGRVRTLLATEENVSALVAEADLLIGAVLVAGARAPRVVTRKMLRRMRERRVLVDIAIDQGGCIETIRATSHADPIYLEEEVLHYAVPNMPAMVGRTATFALTQATEPFLCKFARLGVEGAIEADSLLQSGINVRGGRIVHSAVASALGESNQ